MKWRSGHSRARLGCSETYRRRSKCTFSDDSVSRRHARVTLGRGGTLSVVDLGSTNGTTHNGKAIRRGILRPGDRLELGDLCLVYEVVSAEALAGWAGTIHYEITTRVNPLLPRIAVNAR
jgi:hypothetical protein